MSRNIVFCRMVRSFVKEKWREAISDANIIGKNLVQPLKNSYKLIWSFEFENL